MDSIRRPARSLLVLAPLLVAPAGCDSLRGDAMERPLELWSYTPELRIGAIDDPDYAFTRVSALRIGPDGSIYSLHPQEATIRRWTPDGRPAGGIGRRGQGPGEFQQPREFGIRGDTLWVLDSSNYRFSYFSLDGTLVGDLSPRIDLGGREMAQAGVYPPRPTGLLADGTLLAESPGFSHAIVDGTLTRIPHVRMSPEGGVLDTLAVRPVGRSSVLGVLRDGGGTFSSQPFGDAVIGAPTYGGDGFLVLERTSASDPVGAEFRLTRLSISGDTVFSRGYPYQPVPLPRAEVDSAVAVSAEGLHQFVGERTGTSLAQWQGWVRDAMYAPAFHTPVRDLLPGRDGTLWLGLNPSGAEMQEWLVLEPDGEPLAKVMLPPGLRVLQADRTAVWGIEQDELDVDYIVRYSVTTS